MLQQLESNIYEETSSATFPEGVNPDYIAKQVQEFNREDANAEHRDDVLFRIGSHADVFCDIDYQNIQSLDGRLTSQLRYQVLEWLLSHTEHDIEGNLTLHIFSLEQLRTWYQESKQRYPDFELVLVFEEGIWEEEEQPQPSIHYTCYYRPLPSAPGFDEETDFPVGHFEWEVGEYFWGDFFSTQETVIDFTMECYTGQADFSVPEMPIAPHLLTLTEEEKGHQTVAEMLGITLAAV
ncbi:MAG: hypothetical protein F6K31_05045 [Symploca sp. SIO2G7]|nr:hypothetical protein [Symploca sp. SIO2G7]